MSLKSYLRKRDLKTSPEPKAKVIKRKRGELEFVVQKHAASHLHYDFRLEVDGVLKSWAVPKGPSLDPRVKHLAIMVEDHPYEYRNFEGVIPSGYGAGTVMIWDRGTYSSPDSIQEGLKKGALHFTLEGEKLKGDFSLIKLKGKEREWLLIKMKDEYATKEEITLKDYSVVSKKSLVQIAGVEKPHLLKPMLATLIDAPLTSSREHRSP